MNYELIETSSEKEFQDAAVSFLKNKIESAIDDHGQCIIGLSGGSTPGPIYTELGKQNLDWSKVFIFLVDERYIDTTNKDSNQKMIRDTLLLNAGIPHLNCVFPDTSLSIDDCIREYSLALKKLWTNYLPDVLTLGLGEDGHIASLFPPLPENATTDEFLLLHTMTDRFAVSDRITLTLNPIVASGSQVFLLKGAAKKNVWEEMLSSEEGERRWPAKAVIEQRKVTVISYW